jgi:hypothetical protein
MIAAESGAKSPQKVRERTKNKNNGKRPSTTRSKTAGRSGFSAKSAGGKGVLDRIPKPGVAGSNPAGGTETSSRLKAQDVHV